MPDAVSSIGVEALRGLLEMDSLFLCRDPDREEAFSLERLFHHSRQVALAARVLARHFGVEGALAADIECAALLHDVGQLVLAEVHPESYGALKQKGFGQDLSEAEEGLFGTSHAEVRRDLVGDELSEDERAMIGEHPEVAARLVGSIPRLEQVAQIVAGQGVPAGALPFDCELCGTEVVETGRHMLHALLDFDRLLTRGMKRREALVEMQMRSGEYHPQVLLALGGIRLEERRGDFELVRVGALRNGMVLAEDVKSRSGVLIVTRGQRVTDTLRRCLQNNYTQHNIQEMVRVCAG